MGGILESVDSIPWGSNMFGAAAPEDQSPSVSQPLRYSRRTNRSPRATLVTFRSSASHSRVVSGNRVARQPSRTDLGQRAGVVERRRGLAVAAAGLDELEVVVVPARLRASCSP